jgi:transposase
LFREFERRLSPTMRQHHVAGHNLFVDYSGKCVLIVDPLTGEVRMAEIFLAVLGTSNCTYAEEHGRRRAGLDRGDKPAPSRTRLLPNVHSGLSSFHAFVDE